MHYNSATAALAFNMAMCMSSALAARPVMAPHRTSINRSAVRKPVTTRAAVDLYQVRGWFKGSQGSQPQIEYELTRIATLNVFNFN